MNGPCVGGGIRLAPSARPDDGAVDVVEVLDASRPTVCAFFPLALVGLHVLHPMVRTSRARRVDLGLPTGTRVYSDGEPVHDGAGPACLRIDVLPGAWSLLVP